MIYIDVEIDKLTNSIENVVTLLILTKVYPEINLLKATSSGKQ